MARIRQDSTGDRRVLAQDRSPLSLGQYDQIVIPEFQYGGMENVTATSQNDAEILHPAWSEPQANSVGLMAHELGHQWYGDLLTRATGEMSG